MTGEKQLIQKSWRKNVGVLDIGIPDFIVLRAAAIRVGDAFFRRSINSSINGGGPRRTGKPG